MAAEVLRHDGNAWSETPGVGPSAAVGQDDSVYVIGTDGGLFHWDGTQFNPQGDLSSLAQVSVGDSTHVWVRDGNNAVHRYQGNNTFVQVDLGAGVPSPTHMSANADGTLWHCNSSNANTFRLISESTNPSDTITVNGGSVTGVQKVASTGFGAAHCLVTENGQPQLYRYDSPYVFKTSKPYFAAADFAQGLGNLYLISSDAFMWVGNLYRGPGYAHRPRSRALATGLVEQSQCLQWARFRSHQRVGVCRRRPGL